MPNSSLAGSSQFAPSLPPSFQSFSSRQKHRHEPSRETTLGEARCTRSFIDRRKRTLSGRYSRHYYDVAMMAALSVKQEAFEDLELLAAVVKHKQTFYASALGPISACRARNL